MDQTFGILFFGASIFVDQNFLGQKEIYDNLNSKRSSSITSTAGICSKCSQEPTFKVWSESSQLELRYCWYGQMSPGEMFPGQMSPWQLKSVLEVFKYLLLKFGQNRVSNSWDIRWGFLFLLLLLRKVKPTPSSTGTEL